MKIKNQKELLLIALSVFTTVLAWVIIEVATIRKDTVDPRTFRPEDASKYRIDSQVFQELEQKNP